MTKFYLTATGGDRCVPACSCFTFQNPDTELLCAFSERAREWADNGRRVDDSAGGTRDMWLDDSPLSTRENFGLETQIGLEIPLTHAFPLINYIIFPFGQLP